MKTKESNNKENVASISFNNDELTLISNLFNTLSDNMYNEDFWAVWNVIDTYETYEKMNDHVLSINDKINEVNNF